MSDMFADFCERIPEVPVPNVLVPVPELPLPKLGLLGNPSPVLLLLGMG